MDNIGTYTLYGRSDIRAGETIDKVRLFTDAGVPLCIAKVKLTLRQWLLNSTDKYSSLLGSTNG